MKKLSLWMIAAGAMIVMTVITISEKEETVDELMMSNIEALASGEDNGQSVRCLGSGNVECPNGVKVAYVIQSFR